MTTNHFIQCANCKARLSKFLKEPFQFTYNGTWGEKELMEPDEIGISQLSNKYPFVEPGEIFINPNSLLRYKYNPKVKIHGCCGVSSHTKLPNIVCGKCKAEIGWIDLDCLGPDFVKLLSQKVRVMRGNPEFARFFNHPKILELGLRKIGGIEAMLSYDQEEFARMEAERLVMTHFQHKPELKAELLSFLEGVEK